jgi:hypothetical protein
MKKIILLFLFTSCAFKSLILSNASYLAANRIGNKIDLSWNQEKKLKKEIDDFFTENISEVRKIKTFVDSMDIKKLEAIYLIDSLYPIYERLYLKFTPLISKHMSEYSQKQIKNLFVIAVDDNKTVENRTKKDKTSEYIKRFEFFFGQVSKQQELVFIENKSIFQQFNREKLARRIAFQKNLQKAFLENEVDQREASINKVFRGDLVKSKFKKRYELMTPLLLNLRKSLSKKQKVHFIEKRLEISKWLNLFLEKYELKQ